MSDQKHRYSPQSIYYFIFYMLFWCLKQGEIDENYHRSTAVSLLFTVDYCEFFSQFHGGLAG